MTTSMTNDDQYSDLRREAVDVLIQALIYLLSAAGRQPTASELRIRLREITRDGFDTKRLGFTRFRDFLDYAEQGGNITLDRDRPGDIAVGLKNFDPGLTSSTRRMRRDLWSSFLRWGHDEVRYYDRTTDSVKSVPTNVAPLEPDPLTQLRHAVRENAEQYVAIPPIERETQIGWMRDFAQDVPDIEVKGALSVALASTNSAGEFVTALKNYPTELRRWYDSLAKHVEQAIDCWLSENELQIDIWNEKQLASDKPAELPQSLVLGAEKLSGSRNDVSSFQRRVLWSLPDTFTRSNTTNESDPRLEVKSVEHLRKILHSAIDRMPAEQLRQISIPLGYLINW